jgi:hypothetical protein
MTNMYKNTKNLSVVFFRKAQIIFYAQRYLLITCNFKYLFDVLYDLVVKLSIRIDFLITKTSNPVLEENQSD